MSELCARQAQPLQRYRLFSERGESPQRGSKSSARDGSVAVEDPAFVRRHHSIRKLPESDVHWHLQNEDSIVRLNEGPKFVSLRPRRDYAGEISLVHFSGLKKSLNSRKIR